MARIRTEDSKNPGFKKSVAIPLCSTGFNIYAWLVSSLSWVRDIGVYAYVSDQLDVFLDICLVFLSCLLLIRKFEF